MFKKKQSFDWLLVIFGKQKAIEAPPVCRRIKGAKREKFKTFFKEKFTSRSGTAKVIEEVNEEVGDFEEDLQLPENVLPIVHPIVSTEAKPVNHGEEVSTAVESSMVQIAEHAVLRKIRQRWKKVDEVSRPKAPLAAKVQVPKSILFLHEMVPASVTTEVSYGGAIQLNWR